MTMHFSNLPSKPQYPGAFSLTPVKGSPTLLEAQLPNLLTGKLAGEDLEELDKLGQHLIYLLSLDFCEQVKALLQTQDYFFIGNLTASYQEVNEGILRTFTCSKATKTLLDNKEISSTLAFLNDESYLDPVYFTIHNFLLPELMNIFHAESSSADLTEFFCFDRNNVEVLYKAVLGPQKYPEYQIEKERLALNQSLELEPQHTMNDMKAKKQKI